MGMKRREIVTRFDEIVDFAGVEQFLDTPVKRYSSGMYVRLAFAVAAHLDPEILIVDEVLAVGDAEFQQKCLGRIKEVARGGRTVLFVSHNMASVAELCSRIIMLSAGIATEFSGVDQGIGAFLASYKSPQGTVDVRRSGSGEYRFTNIRPSKESFDPDEPKQISFEIEQHRQTNSQPFVVLELTDSAGQVAARCDSRLHRQFIDGSTGKLHGEVVLRSPWLKPGAYHIRAQIDTGAGFMDVFDDACQLIVSGRMPYRVITSEDAIRSANVLSDFDLTMIPAHCRRGRDGATQPGAMAQSATSGFLAVSAGRSTVISPE
jgi:lipopolysaccharide transport system ATP-binding protein